MFMGLFMLPRKLACFFDRAGWALAMALMAGWVGCGRAPERVGDPVTFDTVLATLTNRVRMALPPQGTMRMVSSYDRTGGNNDWLQGLTPDADGFVTLAELEGPGCIVRIWMTGYRYKELRFYVDGESEPRIQRSPRDFFGGEAPFSSPLNGVVSGGSYGYVPIPYEKSLVIKGLWPDIGPENRPYLQVNYFSYPKGTRVESYPRELSPQQMTHVEAVRRAWEMSTDSVEADMLEALKSAEPVLLKPGSTIEWLSESGEGMLDGFAIALDFAPGTDAVARQQALRSTALHLYWDGQADPGVAVPLGDFFGNALAWRAWRSLFAGQTNGVFFSRWPMPYANGARGTLRNDGPFPVAIRTAHVAAVRPEGARYFHASWHHAVGEGSPYPILHTEGSGHYAGCYLTSLAFEPLWNILEGDESFQVDDEPWPSIHGTGLEDYFNGAWYYTGVFDLPVHGLLEKAAMRTQQYRWHPSDPVPFSERLSMQVEFGHGNVARGYLSSVVFWYLDRPDGRARLAVDLRRKPPDPLEGAVIMAELFELERIGHWRETAERCESYARRIDHPDARALLQLRALGYRALAGDAVPVAEYAQAVVPAKDASVKKQADLLARQEQEEDLALLGVQCRGKFRAYLNGELVGEGNNKDHRMAVWPVTLPDGKHELVVEVTPVSRQAFLSVCLRYGDKFLRTDGDWEMARTRPVSWPRTDGMAAEWETALRMAGAGILPRMDCWQLPLNVWVNMQSGAQLYRGWDGWDHAPGKTAYFRRRFVKMNQDLADDNGR
jgi:hypothetical protein